MPLSQTEFRRALSCYPTGVCAITARTGCGTPVGMIVGSFTSVSLSPQLVGFLPARSSTTWPKIEAAGRFCVNVLSSRQQNVCRIISEKAEDKFKRILHAGEENAPPFLTGALAWIDCDLHSVLEAGDHFLALGSLRSATVAADRRPLIFHDGCYRQLHDNPPD